MNEQDLKSLLNQYDLQLKEGWEDFYFEEVSILEETISEEVQICNLAKSIKLLKGCSNPQLMGEVKHSIEWRTIDGENKFREEAEKVICTLDKKYNALLLQQMEQDLNETLETGLWWKELLKLGGYTENLSDEQLDYLINIENEHTIFYEAVTNRRKEGIRIALYGGLMTVFAEKYAINFNTLKRQQQSSLIYDLLILVGIIEERPYLNNEEKHKYIRERVRTLKRNLDKK